MSEDFLLSNQANIYIVPKLTFSKFPSTAPSDKELKEMRENLNVGDKVTTIGGIIAHVAKVEENAVILEIGPNRTKVPFEKWAIGKVESKEA